jgi:hypothetical protein
MMKQGRADQMSSGIAAVSIGAMTRSVAAADPFPHHISQRERDRHLMGAVAKFDMNALGHAVVGTCNEQDPHLPP